MKKLLVRQGGMHEVSSDVSDYGKIIENARISLDKTCSCKPCVQLQNLHRLVNCVETWQQTVVESNTLQRCGRKLVANIEDDALQQQNHIAEKIQLYLPLWLGAKLIPMPNALQNHAAQRAVDKYGTMKRNCLRRTNPKCAAKQ